MKLIKQKLGKVWLGTKELNGFLDWTGSDELANKQWNTTNIREIVEFVRKNHA